MELSGLETRKQVLRAQATAWSERYSIGIATIDSQHKRWIGLLTAFQTAVIDGREKEVTAKTLDELASYTLTHFSHEEAILKTYSYPDYEHHLAEHAKLRGQIQRLQDDLRGEKTAVSAEVLSVLEQWLVGHISGEDIQYVAHLQAAGVQ